jgi:hypothetical protein
MNIGPMEWESGNPMSQELPEPPLHEATTLWRVFCVVPGEKSGFACYIQPQATVDDLKNLIKAKKDMFSKIDANNLVLYHEEMREDGQLAGKLAEPRSSPPLPSTKEISKVFPSGPTLDRIHIVVEPPGAGES